MNTRAPPYERFAVCPLLLWALRFAGEECASCLDAQDHCRHLRSTWIFMYVSCMYHVLIHTDTYMKPFLDIWKIHEISCIMYWQIWKLLLMVYSIILAITFKTLQVTTHLIFKINRKLLLMLIKQYTFNLIILVLQNNLLFYATCLICKN